MKRVALLASVPLTALVLVAGCDTTATPTTASGSSTSTTSDADTSGPATAPTAEADGASPTRNAAPVRTSDPGDNDSSSKGDPGDGDFLFGTDGSDKALFKKIVKSCPDSRQQPIIQKVVMTDINGDGNQDAIVARSCTAVTSYYSSTVEIFDGTSTRTNPKRVATLLTGSDERADRPWLTKLSAGDNGVTIVANGTADGDPNGCPTHVFTYLFANIDGDFARVSRTLRKSDDCLPVGA